MKGFAVVLLCAFAAAQGRSADVGAKIPGGSLVALGENPSIVHLRVATSTSGGLLNSCAGSLITNVFVLTTKDCVESATFIWNRLGAVSVYNPTLVIEASDVRRHPTENLALINLNRIIETNDNIQIVKIAEAAPIGSARLCGYGEKEDKSAGESLRCVDVPYQTNGDNLQVAVSATKYDIGQPLVNADGEQIGILSDPESGVFLRPSLYLDWISEETELD